jgi:hypothetical protein
VTRDSKNEIWPEMNSYLAARGPKNEIWPDSLIASRKGAKLLFPLLLQYLSAFGGIPIINHH